MAKDNFYIGNYKKDSVEEKGWFLGHFIKNEIRRTDNVEVKYWEFRKGKVLKKNVLKHSQTEYTIIVKGDIDGEIEGKSICLKTGDYIIIGPGVVHDYPINVYKDVEAFTIKAPSIPNKDHIE